MGIIQKNRDIHLEFQKEIIGQETGPTGRDNGCQFCSIVVNIKPQIQEVQCISRQVDKNKSTCRHTVVKWNVKSKERREASDRKMISKRSIVSFTADFSLLSMEARSRWNYSFSMLRKRNSQLRSILPFKNEGEIKTFADK